MKAFIKTANARGAASVGNVARPDPGPGEVRIKVAACSVCGSDIHAFHADPGYEFVSPPVVFGHEFAGTVDALGAGVTALKVGDRVAAISIQGCGHCEVCWSGTPQLCLERRIIGLHYDGGMSEYTVVHERYVLPVPDNLELELAALIEPVSVAVRAVFVRADIKPGDRVVVSGPGPIGLLCAALAQLQGARVLVTGIASDAQKRLPAAAALGLHTANVADATLADHLRSVFGSAKPDTWIEASGSGHGFNDAVLNTRRGGTVSVVALFGRPFEFFPTAAVRSELTLNFSYGSGRAEYFKAMQLLADRAFAVESLIDRFALDDALGAFEAAIDGRALKPLIITS